MCCTANPRPTSPATRSSRRRVSRRPNQVLDKFIAAIGGAQRVASLTSLTAKGTYMGFDDADKMPMELFARASGRADARSCTARSGDNTTTIDGGRLDHRAADRQAGAADDVTGQELEGVKFEA